MQAKIKLRLRDIVPPAGIELSPSGSMLLETTLGRALFNEALPDDYAYADYEVGKKQLGQIVNDLAERYPKIEVANCLDQLKDLGFHWATRSGVTVSIGDVTTPADKAQILSIYEDRANKIDKQYERGLITEDERRQELIEIWTDATSRLGAAMEANFSKTNPIYMMVHSGARGNMVQMRQIAAMRGLVVNPKGEIIARPIKSNFREGLSVLEYFISTHGGRKAGGHRAADGRLGLPDPASGRRQPGRDHPRGGLRHRARADQDHRDRRRARRAGARRARRDRGVRPDTGHQRARSGRRGAAGGRGRPG